MNGKVTVLSALDVAQLFQSRVYDTRDRKRATLRVYGVPRGGMLAVTHARIMFPLMSVQEVLCATEADVIVDDIVDSGRTRDHWTGLFPDKQFIGLVDKTKPADADLGWVVFPWEQAPGATSAEDKERDARDTVARMLEHIGEDPKREGLLETPARVVKSWKALFGGYGVDPASVFKTFSEGACDEMVLLKNIEFYSFCEHHIIPFHGTASIAYIPNKKVIGVSKLVRLLEVYARRLQIQERLCQQVTAALDQYLQPLGSACVLNAQHMCMTARGVQKQGSRMVTSSLTGVFKTNPQTRAEFLQLVGA